MYITFWERTFVELQKEELPNEFWKIKLSFCYHRKGELGEMDGCLW